MEQQSVYQCDAFSNMTISSEGTLELIKLVFICGFMLLCVFFRILWHMLLWHSYVEFRTSWFVCSHKTHLHTVIQLKEIYSKLQLRAEMHFVDIKIAFVKNNYSGKCWNKCHNSVWVKWQCTNCGGAIKPDSLCHQFFGSYSMRFKVISFCTKQRAGRNNETVLSWTADGPWHALLAIVMSLL